MSDYVDLSTMENNLTNGTYQSTFAFVLDGRKLWGKAINYWHTDDNSKQKAEALSKQFEQMVKDLENLPIKELCGKGAA